MSLVFRVSAFNRARKWRLFRNEFSVSPETTVLDVGFVNEESPGERCEHANFLEKHYPHLRRVTAVSLQPGVEFRRRYPEVKTVCCDGVQMPFRDQEFDICWSNAVLEHVGDRDRQRTFLQELRRVSKSGFVTTPNARFPIEVHTRTPLLHLLPRKWFYRYLRLIGKGWATDQYMFQLSERELVELLRQAGIDRYRIVKNRIGPFTVDFVVIFA